MLFVLDFTHVFVNYSKRVSKRFINAVNISLRCIEVFALNAFLVVKLLLALKHILALTIVLALKSFFACHPPPCKSICPEAADD